MNGGTQNISRSMCPAYPWVKELKLSRRMDMMRTLSRLVIILACVTGGRSHVLGQSINFTEQRPFVVGVVPVVGNRSVGGIAVDSSGAIARAEANDLAALRDARRSALDGRPMELRGPSKLRKISLRRLDSLLAQYATQGKPLTPEVLYLAGMQRVEYLFAFPEKHDIVLAGPAEAWTVDENGNVVGKQSGASVLHLEDLIAALRTSDKLVDGELISCSIDPSPAGLQRFTRLMRGNRGAPSESLLRQMEQSVGPQLITLTGVSPETHYAQVLVAADWQMKRLGMGLASSPVAGLTSYLELLAEHRAPVRGSGMPRWWIAYGETPVERDAAGLGWRLSPPGIRVCTAAGRLQDDGRIQLQKDSDPLAAQWAKSMTVHYDELALAEPVFGQLRGCMDLALVTAVLTSGDLLAHVGIELPMLMNDSQVQLAKHNVPKTVASYANALRGKREWVISVSGGVELDVGRVVNDANVQAKVREVHSLSAPGFTEAWWWD